MSKFLNAFMSGLLLSITLVAGCSAENKDTPSETPSQSSSQAATPIQKNKADNLTVYYFHTTYRCWSCNQFEKLTKEILKENFAEELADSSITFRAVNIEKEPNKHFVDNYRLVSKSLVLSLQKNGLELEWKNLDKIWHLVRNTEKFKIYIKSEIEKYSKKIG